MLTQAVARAPHQLPGEEYRVADAVRSMMSALKDEGRKRFEELFAPGVPRGWVIASFVGLLELVRLGIVAAEQEGTGDAIFLRLVDPDADETIAELIESYGHGDRRDGDPASGEGAMQPRDE